MKIFKHLIFVVLLGSLVDEVRAAAPSMNVYVFKPIQEKLIGRHGTYEWHGVIHQICEEWDQIRFEMACAVTRCDYLQKLEQYIRFLASTLELLDEWIEETGGSDHSFLPLGFLNSFSHNMEKELREYTRHYQKVKTAFKTTSQ